MSEPIRSKEFLLSIDPGLATGTSLFNTEDLQNAFLIDSHEYGITEFYEYLESIMKLYSDELMIVIEGFIISEETAKKTPAPWSLELIGFVKYMCWKYEVPLVTQQPVEREFATHEMLHEMNFWHKGGEGHAIQSMKHALVWMVNRDRRLMRKLLHLL